MNERNSKPVRIFVSYRHVDHEVVDHLRNYLGWLENSDQIVVFDDRQIVAGDEWNEVVRGELNRADIILLVVTAAFTRSAYCTRIELKEALRLQSSRGVRVIPIIAENVDLEAMPIQSIAALPKDRANNLKPLNKWGRDRDVALTQVARHVRENVENIRLHSAVSDNAPVVAQVLLRVGAGGASESLVNADDPDLDPAQPWPAQPWPRKGHYRFHRKFDVAADPVFDLMVENTSGGPLVFLKTGIRILQREPLRGVMGGSPCPIKVQAEYIVHCREDWKRFNLNDNESWAVVRNPIGMNKDDSLFRFTLRLENFCDTDNASSSEIRFLLQTNIGMVESESIWLEQ